MFGLSLARGLARIMAAALAMACLSGTAQAAGYTLTWLGDLPGGSEGSTAFGINDAGQVVGYSNSTTTDRAFLWDAVSGMQDLGDLLGLPDESEAYGINNAGQVVGDSTATGGGRAFLWDALNGTQNLNDLIDPGLSAVLLSAKAINASGQIVCTGITDGRWEQAFLLTPISEVPALAALPLMLGGIGLLGGLARRTSKHVAHPAN